MGCLGRFRSKIRTGKGKSKRPHGRPVPGPGASFTSEATCSTASSSAAATSQSQSQDSGATVRPAGSKSSGSASSARSIPELYEERGASSLREFGLRELHAATSDFSRLLKIGEGGFGSVYKGVVRLPGGPAGGTVVAIKRLNTSGHQGHKQWLAEVHFLGVVEHPNLVKLIGYCAAHNERGPQRLLVYEFMTNKTLDDHLFNRAYPVLPWGVRLEIVFGAAQGLMYLHEGLEVQEPIDRSKRGCTLLSRSSTCMAAMDGAGDQKQVVVLSPEEEELSSQRGCVWRPSYVVITIRQSVDSRSTSFFTRQLLCVHLK